MAYSKKPWYGDNISKFYPAQFFISQLTSAAQTFDHFGVGAPITTTELGTASGLTGFAVAADGDSFILPWLIPSDCSLDGGRHDIWIYPWCHIASAAVSGDGADWTVAYTAHDGSTAAVDPATTTGVTAGELTWAADEALTRASLGIKLDLSAATTIVDGTTKMLALEIICSDIDGAGSAGFATNEQTLIGVEIVYNVPQT